MCKKCREVSLHSTHYDLWCSSWTLPEAALISSFLYGSAFTLPNLLGDMCATVYCDMCAWVTCDSMGDMCATADSSTTSIKIRVRTKRTRGQPSVGPCCLLAWPKSLTEPMYTGRIQCLQFNHRGLCSRQLASRMQCFHENIFRRRVTGSKFQMATVLKMNLDIRNVVLKQKWYL